MADDVTVVHPEGPLDRRDGSYADDDPNRAGYTRGIVLSTRAERLLSRDRADHPYADDAVCRIRRGHGPHPWGRILNHPPDGAWSDGSVSSLAHYCPGRNP